MRRRVKESVNNLSRPHFVLRASITLLTSSASAGLLDFFCFSWKCRSARGGIRWTSDETQATAAVPVVGHSEIFITLMSLMCSEYLIRRLNVHFETAKRALLRTSDRSSERADGVNE